MCIRDRAIFNEDMICAGTMIQKGYSVVYAADARVYHSHNYSGRQQFHRNFDLGVSQAEHPEIFEGVPSEGEGIRLVKRSLGYLIRTGHFWLFPQLIWQSGMKMCIRDRILSQNYLCTGLQCGYSCLHDGEEICI